MNLENRIEVGSVSEFLEAVKQIYCDQDHQLFYRGVSKEQYATPEHDHPGIYRNKNWIENEDKMFYELTAKCPEYFKDCKTTFEHLVMMQHYGYPTRLLDITSNPLVALYFACGGLQKVNSEDGQLISYHIKKNDIRNYESDRVSLLSTISIVDDSLCFREFVKNSMKKLSFDIDHRRNVIQHKNYLDNDDKKAFHDALLWVMKNNIEFYKLLCQLKSLGVLSYQYDFIDDVLFADMVSNYMDIFEYMQSYQQMSRSSFAEEEYILKIHKMDNLQFMMSNYPPSKAFSKYKNHIQKSTISFDTLLINSLDMRTIQCVLPKQNNPRLIAQQGAFLLFGFKDAVSDKTETPVIPDEMYGKFETCIKDGNGQVIEKQQSSQKAEIIIKGSEKQKILDELKILGISNSTMFPEIDNIANELKSQYAKLR